MNERPNKDRNPQRTPQKPAQPPERKPGTPGQDNPKEGGGWKDDYSDKRPGRKEGGFEEPGQTEIDDTDKE